MNQHRHFDLDLAELKRSLVTMGNLVAEMLRLGVDTLLQPRVAAREEARAFEERLDQLDNQIEERCHQLIALQSPLAGDLRFLISAMRITADLEQIGDLAEGLCKRATFIARHQVVRNPSMLPTLGALAADMVRRAMESFITGDLDAARSVLGSEREADAATKLAYEAVQAFMMQESACIREYTHLLRAISHLEHIADIAVSIAEEAVYIHRGTLIRHHHSEF